jgi:uncharacterized coiled-coil protein SlyX
MSDPLVDTVTDLEIRIAYQDRTIATLDEVVQLLHKRVERLEQELVDLRSTVTTAAAIGPGNDAPPHY